MRDIPTSPRIKEIKKRQRNKTIRLFLVLFFVLVGVLVGLSFLSENKHISINEIRVYGAQVIDKDEIVDEIKKEISGKYLFLFSKANSFIYPNRRIHKTLTQVFPRIETLYIKLDNLKILNIEITERKGEFLYCGEYVPEEKGDIGENCYFINNNGYMFDKAPYFSGNVYFKFYFSLEEESPLGKQMVSPDRFHVFVRFIDEIESLGFNPIYLVSNKKEGTNYLYLAGKEGGTMPKIVFKNKDSFEDIVENLTLAMKKKEFAEEVRLRYNSLLYIDMRFANKISYKFQ